jgi:hypothetical protein
MSCRSFRLWSADQSNGRFDGLVGLVVSGLGHHTGYSLRRPGKHAVIRGIASRGIVKSIGENVKDGRLGCILDDCHIGDGRIVLRVAYSNRKLVPTKVWYSSAMQTHPMALGRLKAQSSVRAVLLNGAAQSWQ